METRIEIVREGNYVIVRVNGYMAFVDKLDTEDTRDGFERLLAMLTVAGLTSESEEK